MTHVRAVAGIWSGVGILGVGMAVWVAAAQLHAGLTGGVASSAFLFCLLGAVGSLLIVLGRRLQRHGKYAWSVVVGLSAQGAIGCTILALVEWGRADRSALFAVAATVCLLSLRVLLAKEVRQRVWGQEATGAKKWGAYFAGVPLRIAIVGLSGVIVRALFSAGVPALAASAAERGILVGLLVAAALAPVPYLYLKRTRRTRALAVLAGVCILVYLRLKLAALQAAAAWVLVSELGLFVFTAGAVVALAVFHLAIHLFDPERHDTTGFAYAVLVLGPAITCSGFAAAGDASTAVVLLATSAAAFLSGLYAPDKAAAGERWLRLGHAVVLGAGLVWELSLTVLLAPVALAGLAAVQTWGVRRRVEGAAILSFGVAGYLLSGVWSLLARQQLQGSLSFLYGVLLFTGCMSVFVARRFVRTLADNARKTQELAEARRLQLSLLPDDLPDARHTDIAWHMETATEVGGDYYDYSMMDDGTLTLCVGDATGHGMNSGVVVTGTKTLFRTFADAPSMAESLTVMSRSLKGMNLPRMGMSMVLLRVRDSACTVSSAGMPPVMVYRAATGNVEETEASGFPLGVAGNATYQEETFQLSPGDVVLLVSDGLPERLDPQDEYLGYERTKDLFAAAATGTAREICQALLQGGERWAQGRPQDDDITLVVLKPR